MKYTMQPRKRRWPRRLIVIAILLVVLLGGSTVIVRRVYTDNLRAVSSSTVSQTITIREGTTVDEIAKLLESRKLIRSAWAFKLYVGSKEVRDALQAGTYAIEPSQTVEEIVAQLTHGRIATSMVTILPGQRLDQVRDRLLKDGFSRESVDKALDPKTYPKHPALVDKPEGATLEGYLYPDSFQKSAETDPTVIIEQSLTAMQARLTPDRRSAFAKQNLSVYQAIILASIVEQEVASASERKQAAQVFLKRLKEGIPLQSDVTVLYGSQLAGRPGDLRYDSPYNSYTNKGLPPTPINNVSESSLEAVARPAATDWLYFVAGDDGKTYFSKTLEEHERLTEEHCIKLCSQ